jgi:predicted RNA methylase
MYCNKQIYLFCPPLHTVLVMHAGSGAMIRAAVFGGCRAIGFEVHPQFFKLAKANLNRSVVELEKHVMEFAIQEQNM